MKDIDHVKVWKDNITSAPEALRVHTLKKDSRKFTRQSTGGRLYVVLRSIQLSEN